MYRAHFGGTGKEQVYMLFFNFDYVTSCNIREFSLKSLSLNNEIKRLKVSKISWVVLFSVDGLFVEKSIILRGSSVETDWSV